MRTTNDSTTNDTTNDRFVYRDTKKFSFTYDLWEEKRLKRVLTYFYSTKYHESNVAHLDIQNHASYKNGINSISIIQSRTKDSNVLQSIGGIFLKMHSNMFILN